MPSVLSGNVHWNVVICYWCSPTTIVTIIGIHTISRHLKYSRSTKLQAMLSHLIVLSSDRIIMNVLVCESVVRDVFCHILKD